MAEVKDSKQVCSCPECGVSYRVPIGKSAKCPKCAVPLTAPAAAKAAPSTKRAGASSPGTPSSSRVKGPSSRLGAGNRPSGRVGRGASSGRMTAEAGERGERGGRPTREKKSTPVIPIAVGGVVVLGVIIGVFVMISNKKPGENTGAPQVTSGGPPYAEVPASSSTNSGAPDPWAPGSANYVDPAKEKDLDWSKDDSKETDMAKRRKAGFKGELPPESYGQDPKDTGGRPLAGDGTTPPAPPPEPPPAESPK